MNTTTPTLSKNYTASRPIRNMTATVIDELHPVELIWIMRAWSCYEGNSEDTDYNVICELVTPISNTRVWIVDRDGPESSPMLMLPSDY